MGAAQRTRSSINPGMPRLKGVGVLGMGKAGEGAIEGQEGEEAERGVSRMRGGVQRYGQEITIHADCVPCGPFNQNPDKHLDRLFIPQNNPKYSEGNFA